MGHPVKLSWMCTYMYIWTWQINQIKSKAIRTSKRAPFTFTPPFFAYSIYSSRLNRIHPFPDWWRIFGIIPQPRIQIDTRGMRCTIMVGCMRKESKRKTKCWEIYAFSPPWPLKNYEYYCLNYIWSIYVTKDAIIIKERTLFRWHLRLGVGLRDCSRGWLRRELWKRVVAQG